MRITWEQLLCIQEWDVGVYLSLVLFDTLFKAFGQEDKRRKGRDASRKEDVQIYLSEDDHYLKHTKDTIAKSQSW